MSFFSVLKDLFNKNIECGELTFDHMLYFLKKKKYLYLGKNIIVRDGSVCVIVYKNRVTDVILPGKYKINEEVIPETYSRAKIEKFERKHKKIKKIRVGIYFICTQELQNFVFNSNDPFVVKSNEMGKIKGFLEGDCLIRVIDPALFVRNLIHSLRKIDSERVDKLVSIWIGNRINKKVQKSKISMDSILKNQKIVENQLNIGLEDSFDNYGIYIKNIKLKAVNYPKKYQSKINDYMAKHNRVVISKSQNSDNNSVPVRVQAKSASINNTMQELKKPININTFKVCSKCGFKNYLTNSTCNNCKNKL